MLPNDPFEQLRRQAEQFQRFWDAIDTSAVQRAVEQQRRLSELAQPFATDLARTQRAIDDLVNSAAFKQIGAALQSPLPRIEPLLPPRVLLDVAKVLDSATRQFPEALRHMQEVTASVSARIAGLGRELNTLQLAGASVRQSLLEVQVAETEVEREQALWTLLESLEKWLRNQEPSAVAAAVAAAIMRLLPYILGALTIWQPLHTLEREKLEDERYADQVEFGENLSTRLDGIAEAVAALVPQAPRPLLESYASIPLRRRPEAGSEEVARVAPGSLLELLTQKGRWLQVLYFDSSEGQAVMGWVYKRNIGPASAGEEAGSHVSSGRTSDPE